jgi:hypothetical protein
MVGPTIKPITFQIEIVGLFINLVVPIIEVDGQCEEAVEQCNEAVGTCNEVVVHLIEVVGLCHEDLCMN